jgi:hypothetical protein
VLSHGPVIGLPVALVKKLIFRLSKNFEKGVLSRLDEQEQKDFLEDRRDYSKLPSHYFESVEREDEADDVE